MSYRFFKCNVLGGFRLTDLNKNIKQGEFFYVDSHACEASRAAKAALSNNWMIEVTEKEASFHITIPKVINEGGVQNVQMSAKTVMTRNNNVAIPNTTETNRSLESRQAEKTFGIAVPDMGKAEKSIQNRQAADVNKDAERVATPDFGKAERNIRARQNDVMTKGDKDELIKNPNSPNLKRRGRKPEPTKETVVEATATVEKVAAVETIVEKPIEMAVTEPEATIVVQDKVTDLVSEIADNEFLATPNFDERLDTTKAELGQELDNKIRRRRRVLTEESV